MRRKFKIGDKVKVIGYRPGVYPPGVKDELGTEKLFRYMVGRIYTVKGFDKYGDVKLEPRRFKDTVWIEPDLLKLRAQQAKKRVGR